MTNHETASSVAATDLPAMLDLLRVTTTGVLTAHLHDAGLCVECGWAWPCQRVLANQIVTAMSCAGSRVGSVMLHPGAVTDPTLHTSVTRSILGGGRL